MKELEPGIKNFIAFIIITIFWSFIYISTNMFPSYYRLGDDFEKIGIYKEIKSTNTINALKKYMSDDFNRSRFRPVWAIPRVLTVNLFEYNFTLYMIFLYILVIITSYFLYKFLLTLNFPFLVSLLFSLITLTCPASVIWIEISDAENIGMVFLSLSLYFIAKSIYSDKNNNIYSSGFVICLLFVSLSKESFILLIPSIIYLYILLYSFKNDLTLFQSLKKKYIVVVASSLVLCFSIVMVIIFVFNDQPRYAGFKFNILGIKLISDFIVELFNSFSTYMIIIILIIIFVFKIIKSTLSFENSAYNLKISSIIKVFIFFILVTVPQYLNYYKSTMFDRYYLPYFLGFTMLMMFLVILLFNIQGIPKILKTCILILISFQLILQVRYYVIPKFIHSSGDARNVNQTLNSISENVNRDSTILIVVDPVQNIQPARALINYFNYVENRMSIKVKFVKNNIISPVYKDSSFYNYMQKISSQLFAEQSFDSLENKNTINCVFILWGLENNFLNESKDWFDKDKFRRAIFGSYKVYYKN